MKVRYRKEMANHSGPESCSDFREGVAEALTGETGRPAMEPRNQESGMPTSLSETEGNTGHGDNRKSCHDPAPSQTLSMPGSLLHRSWEISSAAAATTAAGAGKAEGRNPATYTDEKSDTPKVPEKLSNKGPGPARRRRWREEV